VSVRELVKDLFRYFPAQVIPAVVGFVSIPVLTNLFEPNQYGDYRLVLALVALASPIAGWLSTANLRFYPEFETRGRLGALYSSNFWLWLLSIGAAAGVWGGALFLLRGLTRPELFRMFAVGLALLLVNVTFGTTGSLVRSRREVTWYSIGAGGRSLLNLGLGLLLVFTVGRSLTTYLVGTVVAGMCILPMYLWQGTRGISYRVRDGIDWTLASSMFRYSFPLFISNAAAWLLRLSDRYIIAAFRGSTEVGIYSASYGLADTSVGVVLTLIQFPFVVLGSQVFERKGDEEAARFLGQAARLYLLVAMPVVAGVIALGRPIVGALTGQGYIEGYRILPFVTTASMFAGIAYWLGAPFLFRKRTELALIGIGAGSLVNVGLNFILIPRYGYMAAAITTLLGYLTLDVVTFSVSLRVFKWKLPLATVARVGAVSLIMAGVVSGFVRFTDLSAVPTILIGVAIGVAVVAIGLIVAKEVTRKELDEFRDLLGGSIRGRLRR
jgi:O-antigen/teichoic acid export membrane protein